MNLAQAIQLAATVHLNHKDKGGNPYILHPLAVMQMVGTEDEELAIIAVLHDLEDSFPVSKIESIKSIVCSFLLSRGASIRVIRGVSALTKDKDEDYIGYIKAMCGNVDAVKVKMADIRHNCDILRQKQLTQKDFDRLAKYHRAYFILKESLEKCYD